MRVVFVATCLIALAATLRPVVAADEYLDCTKFDTSQDAALTQEGVAICTRPINSHRWRGLDQSRLLSNRANYYIKQKAFDFALEDLTQALQITPDYVFAYDDRGDIWRLRHEYDKAIADYSRAISIDPTFISAYYERGRTYEQMGDLEKATADYHRALDIPPSNGAAKKALDEWAQEQARKALAALRKN
jgi:tetratricopeptide (TPR) repeat protein